MPRRAARPCSHPGCPNLVFNRNRRFCDKHQSEEWKRQKARRDRPARDYGPRWRAIRDRVLRDSPLCVRCRIRPSTIAHHIVAKEDGGADTMDNLIAVCLSCHSKIHAEQGDLFGAADEDPERSG
jgi:5-methylcytosine-specific restriction enzyme A